MSMRTNMNETKKREEPIPLFVRICNSHATNVSICNAIIGLKIQIHNVVELQIRQNEVLVK